MDVRLAMAGRKCGKHKGGIGIEGYVAALLPKKLPIVNNQKDTRKHEEHKAAKILTIIKIVLGNY